MGDHIDDTTPCERVCSLEKACARVLILVHAALQEEFPLIVLGFHAAKRSQYRNQHAPELLISGHSAGLSLTPGT
ncbi:MAG: hypothetical protein ACYCXG_04630 [Acidiferrobacter sp.]